MSSEHKRINEKLLDYWESLRGEEIYPSETKINPDELKDIWDFCFLVKVSEDTLMRQGYRYAYLGVSLIDAFGDDLTNEEISTKLIDPTSPPLVNSFDEVVKTGKPVTVESEFTNKKGMVIKYRSCLLPLGEKSKGLNYIIGGMKWKAF